MVNGDALTTVQSVEALNFSQSKDGDEKSSSKALHKLHDDLMAYKKGHTGDEVKQYWQNVTEQLTKDGVLTDLAIAWGKEQVDAKNTNSIDFNGNGKLDQKELSFLVNRTETSAPGGKASDSADTQKSMDRFAQNSFDVTFAGTLSDKKTTKSITDSEDGSYTSDNMDKYLSDRDAARAQSAEQLQARNDMKQLFQGEPPLIQVLDSSRTSPNGHIREADLKRFMDDYNKFTNNGTIEMPEGSKSPYTKANAEFVQSIRDGKNKSVEDGFYVSDLAEKAGMNNADTDIDSSNAAAKYKALSDQFNTVSKTDDQAKSDDKTTDNKDVKPEIVKDDKGHVTHLKYADGRQLDFGYDENGTINSLKITGLNGKEFDVQPGANGEWGVKDADGKFSSMGIKNLAFDTDGHFFFQNKNGDYTVFGDDGKFAKKDSETYKDNYENEITVGKDHRVNMIKHTDGKTETFDYNANGELTCYTDKDGKSYSRDQQTCQWVGEDKKPAPFKDVAVDTEGNVSVTDDKGVVTRNGADGTISWPKPEPQDFFTLDIQVKSGQGFDIIARHALADQLGHAPTTAEVLALSDLIAQGNDSNDRKYSKHQIHPGDTLKIPDLKKMEEQAAAAGEDLVTYIQSRLAAMRQAA